MGGKKISDDDLPVDKVPIAKKIIRQLTIDMHFVDAGK